MLSDGVNYRSLSLPASDAISLKTLRHVAELVEAGAIIVGPWPSVPIGLGGSDEAFRALARRGGAR